MDINCAIAVLRLGMTMFNYLVSKDGTVDRPTGAVTVLAWQEPKSGNCQTAEWKSKGFYFVQHVLDATRVKLPMIGLDGNLADLAVEQVPQPCRMSVKFYGHGVELLPGGQQ